MTSQNKGRATGRVEHTPTPWVFKVGGSYYARKDSNFGGYAVRVTSPFGLVAKVYGDSAAHAEANAAIIDRAVNAHDDLVKALEDIRMMTDGSQSRLAKEICAACDAVLSRIQSNTKES